jgi:hypothetical protein
MKLTVAGLIKHVYVILFYLHYKQYYLFFMYVYMCVCASACVCVCVCVCVCMRVFMYVCVHLFIYYLFNDAFINYIVSNDRMII